MTRTLPTVHIRAMQKALHDSGCFQITTSRDWVKATHTKSQKEVFTALQVKPNMWLVRHVENLFEAQPETREPKPCSKS